MNVTYPFAEMVPNKATEPAKMIIHVVTQIVKPFVLVVCYNTNVAIEFYLGFQQSNSSVLKFACMTSHNQPGSGEIDHFTSRFLLLSSLL